MIVWLLRGLRLLEGGLGFNSRNLNQCWTFMTLIVHHSSQISKSETAKIAKRFLTFPGESLLKVRNLFVSSRGV